jgi:hypothetical protein
MEYLSNMNETDRSAEIMADFTVTVIAERGLGFGDGKIGVEKRLQSETEHPLNEEILQKVDKAMQSPEILVPVDTDDSGEQIDDDGCGDGRGVKVVRLGTEVKKRSLNRSKVFGGGLTMGVAARIGTGEADGPLEQEFTQEISVFGEKELNFGAHTDEHAKDDNCGCGAIDKSPEIIAATVAYRAQIEAAAEALTGISNEQNETLKIVLDRYASYANKIIGQSYKGANVMKNIIDNGKIVKELEGEHFEARFLINKMRGFTANQELVRSVSDGKAQLFAVDEWRIEDLSNALYKEPQKQREAYMSMLVYTLATASVLTAGDIQVSVAVQNEQNAVAT